MAKFTDIQEVVIEGQSPFATEKEVFRTGDGLVVNTKQKLPRCVTGHLIHNPGEMVGACVVCGRYICGKCEILRCSLDNDLTCRDHCVIRNNKIICRQHGFVRLAIFYFQAS